MPVMAPRGISGRYYFLPEEHLNLFVIILIIFIHPDFGAHASLWQVATPAAGYTPTSLSLLLGSRLHGYTATERLFLQLDYMF